MSHIEFGRPGHNPGLSLTPLADQTFYKSFSEKQLTTFGTGRRSRIERHRLALLHRFANPPGVMFEIGPGHGTLGELAVKAGWHYTAVETSPLLMDVLRKKGLNVIESWTPPMPMADGSADVVYADQILEHMRGIDDARQFTAEALRSLRPGGHFFVVVPNYLKEREFFWDVDYTHNFVTTPRRMQQLFYDGGFEILHLERSIGVSTGLARDVLAAAALFVNVPGANTLSRYTGTEELLFKIRKNLFETLTFVPKTLKPQVPSPKPLMLLRLAITAAILAYLATTIDMARRRAGRSRRSAFRHLALVLDDGGARSRGDDPAVGPPAAGQRESRSPRPMPRGCSW